jgi:hypothetical protein
MKEQLTAVEKIITEIDNELQTLEGLDGKEITGSKIALEFVKKVAIEAKEIEKEQIMDAYLNGRYEADKIVMGHSFYAKQYYNETSKQQEQ